MAEIKLNKTELKDQKAKLEQLTKYLPTLQLKKQQLQVEVNNVQLYLDELDRELDNLVQSVYPWAAILSQKLTLDIRELVSVQEVSTEQENIAGVEVPVFNTISFQEADYSYLTTPVWLDTAREAFKKMIELRERKKVTSFRQELLEEELRQTNIKVNLFEKRLIPECRENIKKIQIFLGDQEIASICNAKIAKDKLKRKEAERREA
ncbi:MAG: V-type ATP synthase subunit D [Spirochaetota bacterium]